jgi:hypothetical protein
VRVSLMADSDDEGGAAQQRAGNIEGALTAKGDGQILQQRMAAERLRKQDEMARAAAVTAAAAAATAAIIWRVPQGLRGECTTAHHRCCRCGCHAAPLRASGPLRTGHRSCRCAGCPRGAQHAAFVLTRADRIAPAATRFVCAVRLGADDRWPAVVAPLWPISSR